MGVIALVDTLGETEERSRVLEELFARWSRCLDNMLIKCYVRRIGWVLLLCLGCWQNGFKRPVLKHGPRSLTTMRVFGWFKPEMRNESNKVPTARCSIDRSGFLMIDLSKSIIVRTRKMVNYAWIGWSQRKLWWRLAAVLTCKSIVKFGYRGERLIEPSSSWFPPKFPSG